MQEQSGLVAENEVDVTVGGNTDLKAGIIASKSKDLSLDTGTLTFSDLLDKDKSKNIGGGISIGGPLSGGGDKSAGKTNPGDLNFTIEGQYAKKDKEGVTRATVGEGEIKIRDTEKQKELEDTGKTQKLANLNRDLDKAQEVTKDEVAEFGIYASDTSIRTAMKGLEAAGQALEKVIDAVVEELVKQGQVNEEAAQKGSQLAKEILDEKGSKQKELIEKAAECLEQSGDCNIDGKTYTYEEIEAAVKVSQTSLSYGHQYADITSDGDILLSKEAKKSLDTNHSYNQRISDAKISEAFYDEAYSISQAIQKAYEAGNTVRAYQMAQQFGERYGVLYSRYQGGVFQGDVVADFLKILPPGVDGAFHQAFDRGVVSGNWENEAIEGSLTEIIGRGLGRPSFIKNHIRILSKNGGGLRVNPKEKDTATRRPTPRESEIDLNKDLGSIARPQVSFKNGKEVPYGTKGSVRPDSCIGTTCSFEVKNYTIGDKNYNLINNVAKQAKQREQNLPQGMTQNIIIDTRGQSVTQTQMDSITSGIVQGSDGIIKSSNITFKR